MALVFSALVLEAALRVWVLATGQVAPAPDESLQNEWEWAARHLAAGRPVLESTMAFDSALGWRNAPGLRTPELNTNTDGWRASHDFVTEKPPGTRRVVLVGDSYTFGHGVSDQQTFAVRLAELLGPGWEVLNFAVPGYGTDQQVLSYEHVARRYAPDAVVLGFFLRDASRNMLGFRTYAKPRFELEHDGEGLRLVGVPVPSPQELFEQYRSGERAAGGSALRSWLVDLVRAKWGGRHARDMHAGSRAWRVVARLQERFRADVLADGAVPLWLQIPTDDVVLGEDSDHAALNALCCEHAGRIGLDCLDLTPVFRAHDEAHPEDSFHNPPERGGHLSPTGHRLAAEALAAWVEERFADGD